MSSDAAGIEALFHPLVAEWFTTRFGTPTEAQVLGWPPIAAGCAALIAAPTGPGGFWHTERPFCFLGATATCHRTPQESKPCSTRWWRSGSPRASARPPRRRCWAGPPSPPAAPRSSPPRRDRAGFGILNVRSVFLVQLQHVIGRRRNRSPVPPAGGGVVHHALRHAHRGAGAGLAPHRRRLRRAHRRPDGTGRVLAY